MTFVIKAMIQRTEKWDEERLCFVNTEPYLYNPCGCDYTRIIHDLKTIKGVKNRIKNWKWQKDVVEVYICSSANPTNDDCDKLIERLYPGQFKN